MYLHPFAMSGPVKPRYAIDKCKKLMILPAEGLAG